MNQNNVRFQFISSCKSRVAFIALEILFVIVNRNDMLLEVASFKELRSATPLTTIVCGRVVRNPICLWASSPRGPRENPDSSFNPGTGPLTTSTPLRGFILIPV